MNKAEFEQAFPVISPITVEWGHMDAFQHVNNAVYLEYFQTVRIAYMQAVELNIDMKKAEKGSAGLILADAYCKYRRPVTFPDNLLVGTRVSELHEFGFMMEYQTYSEQQQTVVTTGTSRIVLLDYFSGQKIGLGEANQGKLFAAITKQQPELALRNLDNHNIDK